MTQRYFVDRPIEGDHATLTGPEAHHLAHVMRGSPGLEVVLFDGSGCEFQARVERVSRAAVELVVLLRHEIDRELPFELTLGVALPKGDRQRWLVEKAVETGVTRLVPLTTRRGVAQPGQAAIVRLQRAIVEGSKQCGRNRLMAVEQARDFERYVAEAPADAARLIAHPGGNADLAAASRAQSIHLAIGPEGGFTDEEFSLALDKGWSAVDLGSRILRVETAAIWLTAAVSAGRRAED